MVKPGGAGETAAALRASIAQKATNVSEKPVIQHEIVIAVCFNELHIYPATPDAEEWVTNEATAFGRLNATLRDFSGMYILTVVPNYNIRDVAFYLAKMNGQDTSSALVTHRGMPITADEAVQS